MKVRKVVVGLAFTSAIAVSVNLIAAQTVPSVGSDTAATVLDGQVTEMTLTGHVREGSFRQPDSSRTIKYLYLHLDKPLDIFGTKLHRTRLHAYDVQLFAGHAKTIYKIEKSIGKIVSVRGQIPFTFTANAEDAIPIGPAMLVSEIHK